MTTVASNPPLIETLQETTIGPLLNQYWFNIPLNQRSLAWRGDTLKQLWTDVRDSTDNGNPHFLGFMVFQRAGNANHPELIVQDGQQRLMCMMSIFGILAKTIENEPLAKGEYSDLRHLVYPGNKPRLTLDAHHQHLATLLISGTSGANLPTNQNERQTAKRFKGAFEALEDEIGSFIRAKPNAERGPWVRKLIDASYSSVFVTSVSVTSQSLALKIFDRLNTGGSPLSPADTIKNLLFLSANAKSLSEQQISSHWERLVKLIPFAEVTSYLRYWALVETGSTVSNKDLANALKPLIDSDPIGLIDRLTRDAGFLSDWWTEKNGVPHDPASALALLGRPALGYPLLWTASRLCADGQISSTELDRMARAVESYIFRELTVKGRKTNEIEQHLAASAEYLLDRSVKDAVKVLATGSPDTDFSAAFSTWTTRSNKKQFYVVREIERALGPSAGASFLWTDKKKTRAWEIEHIHPVAKAAVLGVEVNRVGNLVLLEKALNRVALDADFQEKKEIYKKGYKGKRKTVPPSTMRAVVGPIVLGSYTPLVNYQTFEKDQVESRQKQLADLALNIWSVT